MTSPMRNPHWDMLVQIFYQQSMVEHRNKQIFYQQSMVEHRTSMFFHEGRSVHDLVYLWTQELSTAHKSSLVVAGKQKLSDVECIRLKLV
jgi:hypothetical protein